MRQQFPLKRCVRVPGVSRSGYYDRVQHEPSEERLLRPGTACPRVMLPISRTCVFNKRPDDFFVDLY
ncbi:hypothetical protein Asd1617_06210 (plasmid) [Shigella dysenteriae 1617]|uniref:Uncharacterized protein n=1 Tax=Shigella dysenteriae 1617 TaxID=754093 RepID=A0A0A7A479_SHIDY|nr:hypothetical protein Asd1617_06210 [Shigella dysenteriae 1617]